MVGIYKIENLINGKKYIGQSKNIQQRWKGEKFSAFNPNSKSYNYPLSKAFRKYGIENFTFSILEECKISDLNEKERYWVSYYDSFFNGYNQTPGGDGGNSSNPELIMNIINDLKNTELIQRDIAEKWKISEEMVQGINTGRYWYLDNQVYPIREIRTVTKHYCIDCGKEVTQKALRCIECASKLQRKVERPSKEDLLNYLLSVKGNFTEASRYFKVSDNSIRKWCKAYNLPFNSKDYKPLIEENPNKGRTIPKKIAQIDISTDEVIDIYNTIADAYRTLGIKNSSHISAVCRGKRKTAYGYKWKYIE